MFADRLRRYSGLIKLIAVLVGFIILIVGGGAYVNANILQRETFARAKTVNFMDMLVRFGAEEVSLREDIHKHLLMYRDGGRLATPFGPAWDYPAVTTGDFRAILDEAIGAYEKAQKSQDWVTFREDFRQFDQAQGELLQGRQQALVAVQYAAAGIIFFGFLGILALLFFRLGKADDEASAVRRENEHILASTKEGVFLIDSDYEIGDQQSSAVNELFGNKVEVTGNFLEFIRDMVPAEDFTRVEKFLGLVFGGRVKPRLMGDLNPLQNVEVTADRKIGGAVKRILNFDFSRDEQRSGVDDLLVTISDVTKESVLKEELEATQKIQDEKFQLLKGVLHVDPAPLNNFIEKGKNSYARINDLLEKASMDPDKNADSLEEISRLVHRLKGDAASLRLQLFEKALHRFEDAISELQEQNLTDGQSLLKLVVMLKNMIAELDLAASLTTQYSVQSIASDSGTVEATAQNTVVQSIGSSFSGRLDSLAQEVANRNNKQVNFSVSGANHLEKVTDISEPLTEIAVQLVRNAVVHGIEVPEDRINREKPAYGKVHISFEQMADQLKMEVTDDGGGLDFDLIKERAIHNGLIEASAAENADRSTLLRLIFHHGFSSLEQASEDAGRGVGLDAVRSLIKQINGRIKIGSIAKKQSNFSVIVPLPKEG